MDSLVLIHFLESLAEIRALMRCAHRFGLSVGLSGGVVRNIVVADPKTASEDNSLYDFVDPFGDIDIVFAGEEAEGVFLRALFGEVLFADSHVWDSQTMQARKIAATRPGTVAADKLIIWFKGLPGQRDAISVESIDGNPKAVLNDPLHAETFPVFRGELRLSQIGRLIKFARIQMNLETAQRRLVEPFATLANQIRILGAQERPAFTRRSSFPIELELAQLLMTVPDWNDARTVQAQLRDLIPRNWLPEQSTLGQILTFESRGDKRVGAAVYKPSAQMPFHVDFFTSDAPNQASFGSGQNRIPFARLRLNNRDERGCCPYSDFEDGIAVVSWRHTNSEITRDDEALEAGEYGLVGYPVSQGQSSAEARATHRRIPMFGYVRRGRSIVTRLDPAYLKLITGRRFSTFIVGLVSTLVSGGTETLVTNPPHALAPEGEAQDGKPKQPWVEERKPVVA
jgi:hypothetical protein